MSLHPQELEYLTKKIGRTPNETETHIVAAEWSEHCSYKSSKIHLKMLPTSGPRVIHEKGYDSGVLDVGDGYVVTVHIESHNHPSAVEPYGGAATGVGGVIRDILSAGTRPIAILDGLRFGNIEKDSHARWLFKNAVTGIADYGNCLGIPTVGGEVEFDECYTNYALVDVASVGFGKKENLFKNHAEPGDVVVLMGGSTGRDGIGGAQFASDSLETEDRSAVQIPDPFIEKLIIEATLEARNKGCIKAIKDLGGGGLSCAVSETADALGVGIELDVAQVHLREQNMKPSEIMTSESQERMLIITDKKKLATLQQICKRFRISCSVIGKVTGDKIMKVREKNTVLASMPAEIVANAPLLDRPSKRPAYIDELKKKKEPKPALDMTRTLLRLLASPNIASKSWVYGQYDHEVGIRTVVKPGVDSAVLRLDNGKYLAVKIDGNPKHCYLDPRHGAIGCFEEACRNVVCTGATPIGMVDHLQFGNPENPEIFWTFLESLKGITEFSKYYGIPCVGGKVSLYNETPQGPIKPTPLIGVLGLIDKNPLKPQKIVDNDVLLLVGRTKDELGGSEYYEYIHKFIGGHCPQVDMRESKKNMDAVLHLIQNAKLKAAHDCSKGGFAVAASEIAMTSDIGCTISLENVPQDKISCDKLLFSESHSRYLLVVEPANLDSVVEYLRECKVEFGLVGRFHGKEIEILHKKKPIAKLRVDKAHDKWFNSLRDLVLHG
ncbi:phosphoribosylformylglycinamidine synthase subunit PurL [Candidatus Nitrosotenuis uzonensis]|uniref:Phosphoribosylformylglycinamidine synthase subunit PurL n=1 Tax=Candidatus Nitrosotenuis uzonensis TaxID=1407055 RepID=V6ASV4_9ARCH|nr:phosphoribosylformylglycinamidine synthase subunit PurL [Candidatus Nitrosotenuis uzonensis]CDI05543.1 phosphoribosylformylglycinamidine synthetase II [Candidatus Nitrosotenuis uzonensis]